jgi:hypothetical protein
MMSHTLSRPPGRSFNEMPLTVREDVGNGHAKVGSVAALPEPLTVGKTRSCNGPCCSNPITGNQVYCSQSCRNDMHALRRVRELFGSLSDHELLRIVRG